MKRILIQCGDNLENRFRVLSLAERLKAWGAEPLVAVYTQPYASLFEAFDIETVALFDFRNATSRLDTLHRFDFSLKELDLAPLEREKARLAGGTFDAGRAFAAARRALVAVDRIVKTKEIDELVVWNGYTGAVANAMRCYKLAQRMGGGFIERGLVKDATIFDRYGVNGASGMAFGRRSLSGERRERLLNDHMPALRRHFPTFDADVFRSADRSGRRRRLLVPLQVQRDSNIILHSFEIKTMRRLVIEAMRLRRTLGGQWDVVVRPHPEEDPKEILNLPREPGLIIDNETNLNTQLAESSAVVTVNSTVGLEAAFAGCAPIVFGEGIYCREPFVIRAQDGLVDDERLRAWRDDLSARFDEIGEYLAHLFDKHQLQPFDGRASEAESLRRDMQLDLDGFVGAPSTELDGTLVGQARSQLCGDNSALKVHAIGLAEARVNETYRDINVTIRRKTIERAISLQLCNDRPIELSVLREPASGDIAIIGPNVSPTACSGYSVVMDYTGAVRPHDKAAFVDAGSA